MLSNLRLIHVEVISKKSLCIPRIQLICPAVFLSWCATWCTNSDTLRIKKLKINLYSLQMFRGPHPTLQRPKWFAYVRTHARIYVYTTGIHVDASYNYLSVIIHFTGSAHVSLAPLEYFSSSVPPKDTARILNSFIFLSAKSTLGF